MKISTEAFEKILEETLEEITPPNADMAVVEKARKNMMRRFEKAQDLDDLIQIMDRDILRDLLLSRKLRELTDDPGATIAETLSERDIKDIREAVALAKLDDDDGGSQIN